MAVRPPDAATAREIIAAALHAAEGLGVDRRHFKTGLWQALIGTMLAAADSRTVIKVLEQQASRVHGHGSNADSAAIEETEEETADRLSAASDAAAILADHFSSFLDAADNHNVDGIMLMVSVGFAVLAEAWGPDFLRRNLQRQIQALKDDADGPIMPIEPRVSNRLSEKRRSTDEASSSPPQLPPTDLGHWRGHQVGVRVLAGMHPDGFAVFGAAIDVHSVEQERRQKLDLVGTIKAPTSLRAAWLTGCLEALAALPPGDPIELRLVADEFLIADQVRTSWLEDEKDLWATLAGKLKDRPVSWHGSCETADDLSRNSRCESVIRDWIGRR